MKKILFTLLFLSSAAYAQDRILNYQGVLLDNEGQPVADGLYDAFFELYDAQVDGNRLWFDSDLDITTVNGAFSVRLGSNEPISSAIDFTQTLWLEIEVETSPFSERIRLDPEPTSISVLSKLEAKLDSVLNARGTAVPIGTIQAFAVNDSTKIPEGWLLCNGRPYNEADYPELENLLGTTWGTAPAGQFRVPDLSGVFLRGVDKSGRRDKNPTDRVNYDGIDVGAVVGGYQEDATSRPSNNFRTDDDTHEHNINAYRVEATNGGGTIDVLGYTGGIDLVSQPNKSNLDSDTHNHDITGGGDPETRPINAYVYYIIKAK
jgi:microcystin-dependent protein